MFRADKSEKIRITLTVNRREHVGFATPRTLLSDFLRHELGLFGTHVGCEHGVCGACTILIDGRAERGCLTLAVQAMGRAITTVEGLGDGGDGENCRLCKPRSRATAACSAAIARRAFSPRRRNSWPSSPTRPRPRCATCCRATSAAVPATTAWSARSWRSPANDNDSRRDIQRRGGAGSRRFGDRRRRAAIDLGRMGPGGTPPGGRIAGRGAAPGRSCGDRAIEPGGVRDALLGVPNPGADFYAVQLARRRGGNRVCAGRLGGPGAGVRGSLGGGGARAQRQHTPGARFPG